VSLFDLHQSYASSQEIEKKVRQVNQDSKVLEERVKFERDSLEASQRIFKSQVDEYEKYLKNLGKAAQEGKALHALAEMFEAAGVESLPVIRSMRKAVLDQAKELVDCSPEQMEYFDAIEELHYLKYKKEKELSEKAQREKEQAEENKIREVMTSFEIPDRPQYVKILNRLNELKAQGQIKEEITPESVGTYWKEFKKTETLFKVLQDKAPELATSQETVKAIFETVRATNPTVKEFEEFLSHLKSTASEQAAKANGKKKLVEKTSPISAGTKQTAKRDSLFI
jgi:ribosomal protein S19